MNQPPSAARSDCAVAASAGNKVSSASSDKVMSAGVPNAIVLQNKRVPAGAARTSARARHRAAGLDEAQVAG